MPRKRIADSLPLEYRLSDPEDIATNPNYSDEEFFRDYEAASGQPLPQMSPEARAIAKQGFVELVQKTLLAPRQTTPEEIIVPGTPVHLENLPLEETPSLKYKRPHHDEAVIAAIKSAREGLA